MLFPLLMESGPVVGTHPLAHAARIVEKPWGREIWWAVEAEYAGKILLVKQSHRLSLQKHLIKRETLLVIDGVAEVQIEDDVFVARQLTRFTVSPGTVHRFTAVTDCVLMEVSTPHLDDVVRIEDDFRRT